MKFGPYIVKNHQAEILDKSAIANYIASMEGKEIEITIDRVKIKKTVSQVSGVHQLIKFFAHYLNEATGNDFTPAQVKEMIKLKRNMVEDIVDKNTGEVLGQRLSSFSKLDLPGMSELIEWIYSWAATEFNLKLPDLDPEWKNKFNKENI